MKKLSLCVWLMLLTDITFAQSVDPMRYTQPIDVVALVQAIFTGLAALLGAVASIYAIVAASSAKRAETISRDNSAIIKQVEINTNSMTTQIGALSKKAGIEEGVKRGEETAGLVAESLARGQREGRAQANESASLGASLVSHSTTEKPPVPVADERVADAAERSATATERVAAAAEETVVETAKTPKK